MVASRACRGATTCLKSVVKAALVTFQKQTFLRMHPRAGRLFRRMRSNRVRRAKFPPLQNKTGYWGRFSESKQKLARPQLNLRQ